MEQQEVLPLVEWKGCVEADVVFEGMARCCC
jgi:hypothetical protein